MLFSLFLCNILCKFRLTSKKNVSNNKNSHVNCFSKWNKKKLLAIIHGAWFHYFLDLSWTRLIASCWVKEKDKTFSRIIRLFRLVHIFSIFSDKFCYNKKVLEIYENMQWKNMFIWGSWYMKTQRDYESAISKKLQHK